MQTPKQDLYIQIQRRDTGLCLPCSSFGQTDMNWNRVTGQHLGYNADQSVSKSHELNIELLIAHLDPGEGQVRKSTTL